MLNDLNEKLFDSKHTEDIEGFSFDSKDRPTYKLNMSRLLSIFKETDWYKDMMSVWDLLKKKKKKIQLGWTD